jgi:hypothetical protein
VLDGNARFRAFYERQGRQPDGTLKYDTIAEAEVVELRYRRSLNGQAPNAASVRGPAGVYGRRGPGAASAPA